MGRIARRRTVIVLILVAAVTSATACGPTRPPLAASVPTMTAPPSASTPLPTPTERLASPRPTVIPSRVRPTPSPVPPTVAPTDVLSPLASPTAALRPAPTLPPAEPGLITHGDRSLPYVALTFDACQKPGKPTGYDAAIIDALVETETPATLFLGGLWMQSHPTQTQALAAQPLFELGNHSWSHPDFRELSPEEIGRELLRTQHMMYALTGRQPTLFRLPFGTYDDEALAIVARHGLRAIQWDVVTGDPDPNVSAEDIASAVTAQVRNGSIVIMHMNGRGWHTAEALPTLIERLRARGYRLVTVSQLLRLAPVATPVPEP